MKKINVHYINKNISKAEKVPELLTNAKIPNNIIETVNWLKYPYRPLVAFRIAYTKDSFLIHYVVNEKHVRGKYTADNDPVWTDSCCEFFCQPENDGFYYNLECNCLGTVLLGLGNDRHERATAPANVMKNIKRWSSLGKLPYNASERVQKWEVALIIPFTSLWKHDFRPTTGKTIKANFYKCGDELDTPHFLSWNPIKTESPDFHRPEHFGKLLIKSEI